MLARNYQNYLAAIMKAARRKKRRAVDVDAQKSLQGTPWALHWPTLGKNKLHDPKRQYTKHTRIDKLSDVQLDRMRGPKNHTPVRLVTCLELAAQHNVRVEVEVKTVLAEAQIKALLARPKIAAMNKKGLLQFKTLAFMGAPNGPIYRLRPIHNAGGKTILSFTSFRKRGISKRAAWPVTDYVRGRARWVA